MDYEKMSSNQIESELMNKEKELNSIETANEILELEDSRLAKQIAELLVARKDIAPGMIQGSNNVRRIRHDIKTLEILKWRKLKEERGY